MLLLLLPGCVIIQKPEDGKTLSTPSLEAAVFLPFTYKDKSFVAYLDEKDVTSQFIVKAKDRFATATLIKPAPGEHLLKVSACWEWLVSLLFPCPVVQMINLYLQSNRQKLLLLMYQ